MSDLIAKEYVRTFNMKCLHGKMGRIAVGSDSENGVETEVIVFHCDDGNAYVISVTQDSVSE